MILDEVCNLITCGVAKKPDYFNSGVPFLSSKNVKENRFILDHYNYICFEDFKKLTKYSKPEKGDILYTRVGSFGEANVIDLDFEFAIFVSLTLIKPKHDIIYNRYLMYYLNSPKVKKLAQSSTSGIGVQNLNVNTVREFPIELPPLEKQKKIAEILDKADEIRQKDKAIIAKYNELSQSLFLDMFGDPVSNPKGWLIKDFNYFAKIDTKMTKNFEKYADYPHIGIANIEKNTGKLIDYKLVKEENLTSGKYIFTPEHIIYSKIRPNLNKVALPNFDGLSSADSYPIIVNKNHTNRIFFTLMLRSEGFLNFILQHSSRTNIPKVNKEQLETYECIAPPLELQNQFAERIELIEKQKQLAEKSLKKSEELFNSLLDKAFKGEL